MLFIEGVKGVITSGEIIEAEEGMQETEEETRMALSTGGEEVTTDEGKARTSSGERGINEEAQEAVTEEENSELLSGEGRIEPGNEFAEITAGSDDDFLFLFPAPRAGLINDNEDCDDTLSNSLMELTIGDVAIEKRKKER